jgi:hypothetical protein
MTKARLPVGLRCDECGEMIENAAIVFDDDKMVETQGFMLFGYGEIINPVCAACVPARCNPDQDKLARERAN